MDDWCRSPCYFEVAKTIRLERILRSLRIEVTIIAVHPLQTGILANLVQPAKHLFDPLRTRDGQDLSFLIDGEV